jgi:hypothetical protein
LYNCIITRSNFLLIEAISFQNCLTIEDIKNEENELELKFNNDEKDLVFDLSEISGEKDSNSKKNLFSLCPNLKSLTFKENRSKVDLNYLADTDKVYNISLINQEITRISSSKNKKIKVNKLEIFANGLEDDNDTVENNLFIDLIKSVEFSDAGEGELHIDDGVFKNVQELVDVLNKPNLFKLIYSNIDSESKIKELKFDKNSNLGFFIVKSFDVLKECLEIKVNLAKIKIEELEKNISKIMLENKPLVDISFDIVRVDVICDESNTETIKNIFGKEDFKSIILEINNIIINK